MKLNTLSLTACALCGLAAPVAQAELQYDYVELGYQFTEFDIGFAEPDGDGFKLAGSFKFMEQFFAFGEYNTADLDFNVDFEQLQLGAGYRYPTSDTTDVFGTLSYVSLEAESNGIGADDDGFGLGVGYRAEFLQDFEVGGTIDYLNLDNSTTIFGVYGRWFINEAASAGLEVSLGDDVSIWGINIRYAFR